MGRANGYVLSHLMNIWEWCSHKERNIVIGVKFQFQKDWGLFSYLLCIDIHKECNKTLISSKD